MGRDVDGHLLVRAQPSPDSCQPAGSQGDPFSTAGGQRCCRTDGPSAERVRGRSCAQDRRSHRKHRVVVPVAYTLAALARERGLAFAPDALHGGPFLLPTDILTIAEMPRPEPPQPPLHSEGLVLSLLGVADPATLTEWFAVPADGGRVVDELRSREFVLGS